LFESSLGVFLPSSPIAKKLFHMGAHYPFPGPFLSSHVFGATLSTHPPAPRLVTTFYLCPRNASNLPPVPDDPLPNTPLKRSFTPFSFTTNLPNLPPNTGLTIAVRAAELCHPPFGPFGRGALSLLTHVFFFPFSLRFIRAFFSRPPFCTLHALCEYGFY